MLQGTGATGKQVSEMAKIFRVRVPVDGLVTCVEYHRDKAWLDWALGQSAVVAVFQRGSSTGQVVALLDKLGRHVYMSRCRGDGIRGCSGDNGLVLD